MSVGVESRLADEFTAVGHVSEWRQKHWNMCCCSVLVVCYMQDTIGYGRRSHLLIHILSTFSLQFYAVHSTNLCQYYYSLKSIGIEKLDLNTLYTRFISIPADDSYLSKKLWIFGQLYFRHKYISNQRCWKIIIVYAFAYKFLFIVSMLM